MSELNLTSGEYLVGKFPNAIVELHVARKLSPAFVKMGSLAEAVERLFPAGLEGAPVQGNVDLKSLLSDVAPFAEALAAMPDEHVEYVVRACLRATQFKTGGRWAPVIGAGDVQMQPIPFTDTMQIVFEAIRENLGNFTTALPQP